MSQDVKVGLLGWGTVGTGVTRIFQNSQDLLAKRSGTTITLGKIADLDITRDRGVKVDRSLLTTNAEAVIQDPEIQIVVELIGGIEPAKGFILKALKAGKHVVTANKALLAEHWDEIMSTARDSSADIYFEAAVGGGIPVVQALNDGLAPNHIQGIFGIINGTANYILSQMKKGQSFDEALAEAQAKGFAEADPALDVKGGDTMHKLVILAAMAFGRRVAPSDVHVEGIDQLTAQDILYAREELDKEIKLLGIAKQTKDKQVQVRVHPALIPGDHLMSAVHGVYNSLYVIGDAVGPTMFYGKGAGEMPTASAVVSDVIFIARNIHMGVAGNVPSVYYLPQAAADSLPVEPIAELVSQYYLRFTVKEEIGVIAKIAGILSEKGISIEAVIQKDAHKENVVPIMIVIHQAKEKDVTAALETIDKMPFTVQPTLKIRIEDID